MGQWVTISGHFLPCCFDVEEESWKVGLREMEKNWREMVQNNWYVSHIQRKNDCLETLIRTSDVGVQEFHKQQDSIDEVCRRKDLSHFKHQRGLTGFTLHTTPTNKICEAFHFFIIRLIRFGGSVVREQNHSSAGSCLFTLFRTSPAVFLSSTTRLGWTSR